MDSIIIIAVIGLAWLYISWIKFKHNVKQAYKQNKDKGIIGRFQKTYKAAKKDRFGRDLFVSIFIIFAGTIILAGVTGMVIGLITSAVVSVIVQLSAKSQGFRRAVGLPEDSK